MSKIDPLLSEYGESHQNHTNKMIHWICVPLIFFSVVGLVWSIPSDALKSLVGIDSPYLNWATVALIVLFVYYLRLSVSLAFGMLIFASLCLILANFLESSLSIPLWLTSIIIFVVAWIGQFYGHKVEGKKPSFFKDLQFLLIGPAWLMHFIYQKVGISY